MKEFLDQFLHIVLGIILNIPFIGSFIGVNMREYYQRKRVMEQNFGYEPDFSDVMEEYKFFKKDLLYSYVGVVVGGVGLYFLL